MAARPRCPSRLPRVCSRLRAAACAALAWVACATAAAGDDFRLDVKDAYYGSGLFDYFGDRYFSALTGLMVSQHFGRMPHHGEEAEMLRAVLLLAYGIPGEAGEILSRLAEKGTKESVRDRAWFHLASIRFQRGELAAADAALGHIQGTLPADLEEEGRLLKVKLQMARGDYAGAGGELRALPIDSVAAMVARYNLGVALVNGGDAAGGYALLDAVGQAPAQSDEALSLRDKANVTLGYAALREQAPEKARGYLERVRLSGLFATKALLGFGWAEATLKRQREALLPWTELTRREPGDAAVLEARLAVPYALGELGARAESLRQYEAAVTAYEQENLALEESIGQFRSGKAIDLLLSFNPGEEMGELWIERHRSDIPHPGHLESVLVQAEFQVALQRLRDLRFLERNLRRWESGLDAFDAMLAGRHQSFADRLATTEGRRRQSAIGELVERRRQIADELADVDANSRAETFADVRERALAARIEQVRAMLARHADDATFEPARERYRRLAGALTWQLSQEFTERLGAAASEMASADETLAEARAREANLLKGQNTDAGRYDAIAARAAALRQRAQELLPRVSQATAAQAENVQQLAVAELLRQKERIDAYATQARFAVAQIYDRASRSTHKDSSHAADPAAATPPR
jgi:hypothetical protein